MLPGLAALFAVPSLKANLRQPARVVGEIEEGVAIAEEARVANGRFVEVGGNADVAAGWLQRELGLIG